MLKRFLTDPRFLLRSYAANVLVLGGVLAVLGGRAEELAQPHAWVWLVCLVPVAMGGALVVVAGWGMCLGLAATGVWMEPGPAALALVPVGGLLGLYSAALMHWSVHGSLRPRWINRIVGEVAALQQLVGWYGWGITHLIHHRHPDDPQRDAHPPRGLGFWAYGQAMKRSIVATLRREYLAAFGDTPRVRRTWMATTTLLAASRLLRGALWLVALGPYLFTFLYLPSFVTQMLFYVHFNWATHRPLGDGRTAVRNLDHGPYYRAVNALLFGSYYHRNHHLRPALFDPRRLHRSPRPGATMVTFPRK